ncbi:hypothetical protein FisN_5Lh490 [Fistulifera solaris]|uniref:SGNH hydrolase-type esterase domain-containing protein n=1 Tax=Fistulifera solaris TaxID=1519565 RepID=A0A1Z5KH37_FISSO|nr:hypothetical protein FisN_5Lh490 [Fistulifera solaris]|eukprot:GAX25392.1 hypothetical protein FisN_5Lh490 [Fistulifera solaris]
MSTYRRAKIILLGDSLTQTSFEGWGGHLANVYQRRADVINRGFSGYNTNFFLRLPMEDFPSDTSLVTIFFGANDASLKDENPHHYVSLEDYAQNLKTILDRVRQTYPHCGNNILFITPPPVVHEQRFQWQKEKYGDKATGVLERTLENAGKYAEACKKVAAEVGLPCLDLYTTMQLENEWQRFFNDGLHFSADGHKFVGDALVNAIQQHFPSWTVHQDPLTGQWANSASSCEGLSSGGPFHDEIDHLEPEKAFAKHFGQG